ncbi:unnamed protein product, partial [marine sediment metagenome]
YKNLFLGFSKILLHNQNSIFITIESTPTAL